MDIRGKTILLLGGAGQVGLAIAKKMLHENPKKLVISSLFKEESEEAINELKAYIDRVFKDHNRPTTEFVPESGNIFVREELVGLSREEILNTPEYRDKVMEDVLGEITDDIVHNSHLYKIIHRHKPEIIIDAINTATALAYQDIYSAASEVKSYLDTGDFSSKEFPVSVARLVTSLYIPQLVRHIQILYRAMMDNNTQMYVKIGTTGTGGMGLNIPYTHGEERPSRVLLSKSAVAGAQTLLLFLMARTPDAPIIKEIKPASLIAWKRISSGEIKKRGQTIYRYDCPPNEAVELKDGEIFDYKKFNIGKPLNVPLKAVFIDTGENGVFSLEEFKAITTLGQMQAVTPEEIAKNTLLEIKGGNTSKDVIDALDGSVMGSTYRAGFLRKFAIKKLEEEKVKTGRESIAFEILGPPRLTKLIFEAYILKNTVGTMEKAISLTPEKLSVVVEKEIQENKDLRSWILSVGIPILLSNGKKLLFVKNEVTYRRKFWADKPWKVTHENIKHFRHNEWVDLTPENMAQWQKWFQMILGEKKLSEGDTSSYFDRSEDFWPTEANNETAIDPGEVAGWIFTVVEQGSRMKD